MAKSNIKVSNKKKAQPASTISKPAVSKTNSDKSIGLSYYLPALLVLAITFVVFIPSLSCGFVNWDDPQNLLENKTLSLFGIEWSWQAVKTIFSTDVIGNYNPLPIFTFAIEKHFFASNPVEHPFVFHFNNLWMHLMCTLFVSLIFTQLGVSRIAAVAGALFFGIHPMRVESVTWITERKDVLYGMFFLASLFTYIKYTKSESSKTKWYILTIVLSVFAYFSKVQAVTLPLSMLAIDFYLNRNWKSIKVLVIEKMPWWLLSLACGLVNIWFLKQNNSISSASTVVDYNFIDKLAVGAYTYLVYLIKWIYPYKMSPLYPYSPELPIIAYICLALVPIAIIACLIWSFKKQKTTLLFVWSFFTFNVMFLLQIVGAGQGFLADRFTYIAYAGLFFLTAKLYDWITANKASYKMTAQIGLGLYVLLFIYQTTQQQKIWKNGGTLWEKVKLYYPNSPLAWKNAAQFYRDEAKDRSRAIENYKYAMTLEPKNGYIYNDIAKVYTDSSFSANISQQARNDLQALAIQYYNIAVAEDSAAGQPDKKTTGEIFVNRGAAYAMSGNLDKALPDLNKGLEINPDNLNGYVNRAILYAQINRYDLSLKDKDAYIERNPNNSDVYYERGVCKINLGKTKEAIPDFDKAIALNNSNALYYIGRAHANKIIGNTGAVSQDVITAKQLGASIPAELLK